MVLAGRRLTPKPWRCGIRERPDYSFPRRYGIVKKSKKATPTTRRSKKVPLAKSVEKASKAGSSLQRHFMQAGLRFDLDTDEVLNALKQVFSKKRYREWHAASVARQSGWGSSDAEYETLRTAEEVNTLFSLQSHVTLVVCEWLAVQVAHSGLTSGRIGDLGCGSGLLTSWLAKQHPDCEVVGWDGMQNFVEIASKSQRKPNLSFHQWNYAEEMCPEPHSFDILLTCFGVDFPIHREMQPIPLDTESLRSNDIYRESRQLMRTFFAGWATAIKKNGHLYAVLRIPSEPAFLGVVDAAHDAGWHLDLERYEYLSCDKESFPGMPFRAASTPAHSEEIVRSLWCRETFRKAFATTLTDAAAVCAFKSLASPTILKTGSQTYDDGHTMEAIVGTAGYLGFQYTHATTGFARLKLMSLDEALRSEPWFPSPQPIEWMF